MNEPTPLPLGGDAWLLPSLPPSPLPSGELQLPLNSLLVRGDEPLLVDTGAAALAADWWAQVERLVDPEDVRWVFISHDDADAVGNLGTVLQRCPAATVLTTRLTAQRLAAVAPLPTSRCRWIGDGEHLTVGRRRLYALRPPAYDSPGTLGLFDPVPRLYWAADCFGAAVPHPVAEAADLDDDVWSEGFLLHHHQLSPWAADVEPLRWRAAIGRVAALGARTIASGHGPAIRGPMVGRALDLLGELPAWAPASVPLRVGGA